jgi:hypothetical protein
LERPRSFQRQSTRSSPRLLNEKGLLLALAAGSKGQRSQSIIRIIAAPIVLI